MVRRVYAILSAIFGALSILYACLGSKTAFMFSITAFTAPLTVLFLALAKTPKGSKYLFGKDKGVNKMIFVVLCISAALILFAVVARATEGTMPKRPAKAEKQVKSSATLEEYANPEDSESQDLEQRTETEKEPESPAEEDTEEPVPEESPVLIKPVQQKPKPQAKPRQTKEAPEDRAAKAVKITYDLDSMSSASKGKQLVKVYIKNISAQVISGDVHVEFFNSDKTKFYGGKLFGIKELQPGQQTWGNMEIKQTYSELLLVPTFSDITFEDVPAQSGDADEDTTAKIKTSYQFNFDGTSWYNNVLSITAYADGTASITVSDGADAAFLGNTILNCGKEYGITSVTVLSQSGAVLAMSKLK